jgi:flagellar assembly protein FliH
MSIVVPNNKQSRHSISTYSFKDLKINPDDDITHVHKVANLHIETDNENSNNLAHENGTINHNNIENNSATQQATIDKTKQELLDKLEFLSGGIESVKTEMISHKESVKSYFETDSKQAYDSGYLAGKNEILEEFAKKDSEIKARIVESISLLENEKKSISLSLDKIETELIKVSLDIASEVVKVEIDKKHQEIATKLAKELIKEVKNATLITIKVNTEDYDMVSKAVSDENIKVEADRALVAGGIMLISDIGNLDGTIKNRFLKIKSSIYE